MAYVKKARKCVDCGCDISDRGAGAIRCELHQKEHTRKLHNARMCKQRQRDRPVKRTPFKPSMTIEDVVELTMETGKSYGEVVWRYGL